MGFEEKLKKTRLIKRVGLVCLLGGFGTSTYAVYQLSENMDPLVQKGRLEQQIFDCVNAGASYDEATQVSTIPKECYAQMGEYRAFLAKPETQQKIENMQFYTDSLYGTMGLAMLGMIVSTFGKVKERKAMLEKGQAEEADDDEE